MTRDGMIMLLREHLSDGQAVGWPTDHELLAYLDSASGYLSDQLIAAKDPAMAKEMETEAGENLLPDDFVALVGNVPARISGRKLTAESGGALRYWAKLPLPSASGEKEGLPYTREQELLMTDIAAVLALNRNEYDVSQDMAIFSGISKGIAAARGR
jgi:hypothetical protein